MSNNDSQRETHTITQDDSHIAMAHSPSDSDVSKPKNRGGKGRRKIDIKYIDDKTRRQITFSKRKAGLMKKAYELSTLTGTQILVLVTSETGHVYTFATKKFQPFITDKKGKSLIQQCLSASEIEGSEPTEPEESETLEDQENPRFEGRREGSDGGEHKELKKEHQSSQHLPPQIISGEHNMPHGFPADYQRYGAIPPMMSRNMNSGHMMNPQFHQGQHSQGKSENQITDPSRMMSNSNFQPQMFGSQQISQLHAGHPQFFPSMPMQQMGRREDQHQGNRQGGQHMQHGGFYHGHEQSQKDESSQQKY